MPGISNIEFIELFNQMYQPVKNYVYYKSGDIDLADDIAQETFLKIWEKKNKIRQKTIKSLLYAIAGNLCKNRFDHQRVVFEFASNYTNSEFAVTPEFELELKEFDKKLKNAIGQLDKKKRTVFLMNRIDKLTYKEIAANLGLSEKTIEKRMKCVLQELKKTIAYKL